jgi:hypothetical protein
MTPPKSPLKGNTMNNTPLEWQALWDAMDEMVADCYEVPKNLPSFMTITLDYVALQQDYSTVEIDGTTYFYR